jgi:4a-hydroxytetrahydrobiopterin dehydratase
MGQTPKLTDSEIRAAIAKLPGWSLRDGKLHRDYTFPDFVHAFGFMATAAIAIEAMNHHPDWSNVWNKVTVDLVTHDGSGVTRTPSRSSESLAAGSDLRAIARASP